jgi:hypothetical protein
MSDMPDPHTLDDLKHADTATQAVATQSSGGFTVEELRLLVGRQHSLSRYVPIAIDVLEQNPLAEGDYYPGDLLNAVLGVDAAYWRANREQWERVDEIVDAFVFAQARLTDAVQAFRARRA